MMSRLFLLISMLVLSAAHAAADDPNKIAAAVARFKEGRGLIANGRYLEACAKFDASYELDPQIGALLNRAACREKLGQTATAWTLYDEAIGLARRENDARREAFARERAATLEPALRYLTISVPEDAQLEGLVITCNAKRIELPLWNQRMPVDPGRHVVHAEAPGFSAHTVRIEILDEDIELRIPRLVARLQAVTPEPNGMPISRKLALVGGVVAAAGLINGGLFALRSRSKTSAAEQLCTADFQCTPEGVALVDEARTVANVSYVSYGLGLAAGAVAVVLWLTASPRPGPVHFGGSVQVTPVIRPGSTGLDIEVRF